MERRPKSRSNKSSDKCLEWLIRRAGAGLLLLWLASASVQPATELFERPAALAHLQPGPAPVFSPEESLQRLVLPPGFRAELVASEPMVQDPVAMAFDEDGRLWVVEMRGFMPNLSGEGEEAPVGRITILEDLDQDGRMDQAAIFMEGLVLPRAIGIVKGGVLVAENNQLWFVQQREDGTAGKRMLVDPDYGGLALPEHAANGLWRGLDNWIYNAKSKFRYRWMDGDWAREETEFRGQWGICHDDYGRLFYNYNWSQLHTDLVPPNYLSRNPHHHPSSGISVAVATNQSIFPIRMNTAVNRGYIPGVLNEQGRLRQFTSAGAPFIYRGHAFPREFQGNAFVCEPAGNLVKRLILEERGLDLSAHPARGETEFIASTDERFRPVWLAAGPDGALYLADMYRGVIQHRAHITQYLVEESLARKLDQPVNLGRIFRIVPEGWERKPHPPLSRASSVELVELLSHPNGWHRDTSQRLLVERGDDSILQLLQEQALNGTNALGRLHALWTLEGIGGADPAGLWGALRDCDPKVQANAIRLLAMLTRGDARLELKLLEALKACAPNLPIEVKVQAALSAGQLEAESRLELLFQIITAHPDLALMRDAVLSSLQNLEIDMLDRLWSDPAWAKEEFNQAIFIEMLAGAIMRGRKPAQISSLLARLDLPPEDFGCRERALLAGISLMAQNRKFNPVELEAEPPLLSRLEEVVHPLERVQLEKLGGLFRWPGQAPIDRSAAEPARPLTEVQEKLFVQGRSHYLAACAGCHGLDGEGMAALGPPLVDSEWVLGSEKRLVLILLHGMEGPVDVRGKRYDLPDILPEMPSMAGLDNAGIAAVLTYIRRAWGHGAEPIETLTVNRIRVSAQGRGRPWTQSELLAISD